MTNYKQIIKNSLDDISNDDLTKIIDLAFSGYEKGDVFACGANEVLGVLLGAYHEAELIESLKLKAK